jgi:hypothetical protein
MVAMLCTAFQTGRFTFSDSRRREQRAKHPIGTVGALWVGSLSLELGRGSLFVMPPTHYVLRA